MGSLFELNLYATKMDRLDEDSDDGDEIKKPLTIASLLTNLKKCPKLHTLNLFDNFMKPNAVDALCELIQVVDLVVLNISDTCLQVEHVLKIANSIRAGTLKFFMCNYPDEPLNPK